MKHPIEDTTLSLDLAPTANSTMQLTNRPDIVWMFGYVRLGIVFLYPAVVIVLLVISFATEFLVLTMAIPVALGVVGYLDHSMLFDPVDRIVLSDPLVVKRVVRKDKQPLSTLQKIEISLRENLEYAEQQEGVRKFVVLFVFDKCREAKVTIGIKGLSYLLKWAEDHKVKVINSVPPDEIR